MVRGLARWHDPESPTGPYAAAAFGAGLVFFAQQGKLPSYILPLAPLAALVVTFELGQELVNPTRHRAGSGLVATTLVALSVGLGVASAMSLENSARGAATTGAAAFGLAALGALWGVLRSAPRVVYARRGAGDVRVPPRGRSRCSSVLATTRSAAPLVAMVPAIRSARPLVIVDTLLPSLTYYADRVPEKITGPAAREAARARRRAPRRPRRRWTWTSSPEVQKQLREVGRSGKLRVFETADVSLTPAGSRW